jgi:hypothetical protein
MAFPCSLVSSMFSVICLPDENGSKKNRKPRRKTSPRREAWKQKKEEDRILKKKETTSQGKSLPFIDRIFKKFSTGKAKTPAANHEKW